MICYICVCRVYSCGAVGFCICVCAKCLSVCVLPYINILFAVCVEETNSKTILNDNTDRSFPPIPPTHPSACLQPSFHHVHCVCMHLILLLFCVCCVCVCRYTSVYCILSLLCLSLFLFLHVTRNRNTNTHACEQTVHNTLLKIKFTVYNAYIVKRRQYVGLFREHISSTCFLLFFFLSQFFFLYWQLFC